MYIWINNDSLKFTCVLPWWFIVYVEYPRGNEKLTLVLDEVTSDVGFSLSLIDKFEIHTCVKDDPFIFHYQRLEHHCDIGLVACLARSTSTRHFVPQRSKSTLYVYTQGPVVTIKPESTTLCPTYNDMGYSIRRMIIERILNFLS